MGLDRPSQHRFHAVLVDHFGGGAVDRPRLPHPILLPGLDQRLLERGEDVGEDADDEVVGDVRFRGTGAAPEVLAMQGHRGVGELGELGRAAVCCPSTVDPVNSSSLEEINVLSLIPPQPSFPIYEPARSRTQRPFHASLRYSQGTTR